MTRPSDGATTAFWKGIPHSGESDAPGCVRFTTNPWDEVVFNRNDGTWGATLPGFDDVPVGMSSRFADAPGASTGPRMAYTWQRCYDPSTRRFISLAPIGLEGGSYPYACVANRPINFVDPDGLDPDLTTEQLETLNNGLGLYNDFLIGELGGRVFSELLALLRFRTICPPRYPRLIRGDGRSMVKQTTNELKFKVDPFV